jgi:hypothetical protein
VHEALLAALLRYVSLNPVRFPSAAFPASPQPVAAAQRRWVVA